MADNYTDTGKMTEKQKVQEITEKLEQGMKELFQSETYKSYLNTMSKFHTYSFNNTMLIAMQKPDAMLVAGYKAWQKNFDRHVKKGEKGIRILAPAPYKIKEEQEKTDPETGEIVLDKNGMPVIEEVEVKIPAFRVVSVFDVSQTDGKELPDIGVSELSGSVQDYEEFMQALTEVSPVPVSYEQIDGESKGYFHTSEHRIALQEGMSQSQTVKTAVHEVAHAKLHDRELNSELEETMQKDRRTKEVEAESIAYTVCQHFGIDTSDYSFGYIAGWSSGKDMTELKSSLDTIRRTASELINGIEAQLQELQKDRVMEQEQTQDIVLLVANTDLSEYDLLNVRGMSGEELVDSLTAMNDDDRLSVEAYLESKGGWVTSLADEQTEEVEEYQLDYAYNTDTYEVTDVKARMMEQKSLEPIAETDVIVRIQGAMGSDFEIDRITNMSLSEVKGILLDMASLDENEWDGNAQKYLQEHGAELAPIMASDGLNEAYAPFFDLEYDFDKNDVTAITELSIMQQAENLIHRLEFGAEAFSDDERNLIVNHAYKLGDMEKTKELAENIAMLEENSPNLVAQTVINAQAEIDALPDGMVGLSQMHEYGYTWMEMLPLTWERAAELFGEDVTIYQLHEDGSETLVENTKDLQTHEGMFGVEKADWNAYLEHQSMNKELEESPANREVQFLHGSQNQFGIYQLNDSPQAKEVRFMNSDFFEMKGVAIARENYNLVYTAPLEEGMTLEDIYTKFNIDHPEDFTGHSLSVSDVVVLHQDGENRSFFVDSIGYKEVPEFTQEMTEELQAEQTSTIDKAEETLEETATEASEHEEKVEITENDKVSYYVIEDISTWADNSPEKSRLERFDSLSDAIEQFSQYRADIADDSDERARTTLGASVNGVEFDVAYAVRHENILSLDFTHSQTAQESGRFMEALQTLCIGLPIDKVRVHRDMTPEEKKDFVKRRFAYQLKQSGIDDDSFYMARFDALYEQGKMDNLMPTANQQHIVEDVPYTEWDNPYFHIDEPEQMAFSAGHRYISIQSCTDGYDYSVFNADYRLLDGGVYDNPNISIHAALKAVMEDFEVTGGELVPVDYEELMEKTEAAGQTEIQEKIQAKQIVSDFKAKTNEMFHEISGLNAEDMEMSALAYILSKIDEYDMDAEIVDVVVSGSRCRGLEQEGSDIDIVVEYKGSEKEDALFDVLHEDGLKIGGVKVDINPITEGKTGTLAAYLPGVESYLEEKRTEMEKAFAKAEKVQEKTVTLTVAECSEFHNLGEFHENIASVEEAIGIFQKIPPERMNGIPSIGINIHTEGTETYEDVQMDIFSGGVADLEMLDYVPDITDEPKAVAMIQELIDKLPDIEVRGSLEKWQAVFLAEEIDQLSYDYDPNQYKDTVEDREAQVANITEDIRSGNTEYLSDFLNAIIAEEVREGITDIFGQGTEPADSEAVQTARKAKELLDRLAEYKPLAKVEELEEQNYNMIDNVLNNGAERKETEQSKSRISVREKLAEKKAVIEKRDKAERDCLEKDTEKKVHREM